MYANVSGYPILGFPIVAFGVPTAIHYPAINSEITNSMTVVNSIAHIQGTFAMKVKTNSLIRISWDNP